MTLVRLSPGNRSTRRRSQHTRVPRIRPSARRRLSTSGRTALGEVPTIMLTSDLSLEDLIQQHELRISEHGEKPHVVYRELGASIQDAAQRTTGYLRAVLAQVGERYLDKGLQSLGSGVVHQDPVPFEDLDQDKLAHFQSDLISYSGRATALKRHRRIRPTVWAFTGALTGVIGAIGLYGIFSQGPWHGADNLLQGTKALLQSFWQGAGWSTFIPSVLATALGLIMAIRKNQRQDLQLHHQAQVFSRTYAEFGGPMADLALEHHRELVGILDEGSPDWLRIERLLRPEVNDDAGWRRMLLENARIPQRSVDITI